MPSFSEHISQSKRNLKFLELINSTDNSYWDWQVTVSFYCSLHLINAHIAQKVNLHYRKHEEVNNIINPYTNSPCPLPEDIYLSYMKLQGLSRRARYLIHEDKSNKSETNHFTYDKHLCKAIKHLDNLMKYFQKSYDVSFEKSKINCIQFKDNDITFFIKSS